MKRVVKKPMVEKRTSKCPANRRTSYRYYEVLNADGFRYARMAHARRTEHHKALGAMIDWCIDHGFYDAHFIHSSNSLITEPKTMVNHLDHLCDTGLAVKLYITTQTAYWPFIGGKVLSNGRWVSFKSILRKLDRAGITYSFDDELRQAWREERKIAMKDRCQSLAEERQAIANERMRREREENK